MSGKGERRGRKKRKGGEARTGQEQSRLEERREERNIHYIRLFLTP